MPSPIRIISTTAAVFLALALANGGFDVLRRAIGKHDTGEACRCFPGDACWPSLHEWSRLNDTLGGKLIQTVPIGSVCHDSTFGAYDGPKCEALRSAWLNTSTHDRTSSSPMMPFFANMSCDPFTRRDDRCVLGTHVQFAVDATTVRDYQETLLFARQRNIRLVIRNTGHDYLGKSTGAGGLALWTHNNKAIEVVDYDSERYRGKALRVGAGVQSGEAQRAAHDAGLIVVGGNCPSVGLAGGFTQGAGLSPISSRLGLSADNVLEWEVVTAAGEHLVATPDHHRDLYWALSGGGGGTFAAVLAMTVKAYLDVPVAAANLTFSHGEGVPPDAFWGAVATFLTTLPAIVDTGATVIWALVGNLFMIQPLTAPEATTHELQELLRPTLAKLNQSRIPYTSFIGEFPSYLDSISSMNPDPGVTNANMGGRLIPRSLVAPDGSVDALTESIRFIVESGLLFSGVTFNVSRSTSGDSNSVNIGWRSALFNAVIGTPYNQTSLDANIVEQRRITEVFVPRLAALTPGGSAYLNEADYRQPQWQNVFYGGNYQRLLDIKRRYDPHDLFYGLTAVGSEAWTVREDGRLCRTRAKDFL